jgi:hypothetical protein
MISEQEFLNAANNGDIYRKSKEPRYGEYTSARDVENLDDGFLYIEWVIGGITGNSCWGKDELPVEANSEPSFEALDKLLEEVFPTISYLQFKRLEKLIKQDEYSDGGDYYGNYYKYTYKVINLRALYDELQKMIDASK